MRINNRIRHIGLTAAALLAAAVFAGAAQSAELKTWRHGVVQAKGDAGLVFMASKGGFAEKQGLKIDMLQFKGDALALKAMLAGEIDSYEGNPGGPLIALSRGADIKIIGCYWPGLTYGIYARSSIASVKDLKGKTFAISSPGSLPDLVVRAILETVGLSASDIRFVIMGSDADRFRAVTAGIVDAGAASTQYAPVAVKSGVKLLVQAHDVVPNYLRFCIYTTGKTLAQRGDEVAKFLAAEMSGLRYALANRDKAIALTREVTGTKPDNPGPAYIYDEVKRYNAVDPDMPIPMDKIKWLQQLLVRTGNLAKPSSIAAAVDDHARTKALELSKK